MQQTFTLPYPPSANRYWRNVRGRTIVSAEAKAYKAEAGWSAKAQGACCIEAGNIIVKIDAYRPRRRGDLDNVLKITLDALNGVAYADDSQITRIEANRYDDKDNPRVEIGIRMVSGDDK